MRQAALILVLFATACDNPNGPSTGSSNAGTGGGNNQNTCVVNRGTMTAIIDGVSWVATCVQTASFTSGTLTIAGADSNVSIGLTVTASTPGNYSVTTGQAILTVTTVPAGGGSWTASAAGGTGSVLITRLDAQGATGTFQFSAIASPNTPAVGTKNVVNGSFSVSFQ